jgi:23S rRNA pseudouridine1911/1915/1917 synthase
MKQKTYHRGIRQLFRISVVNPAVGLRLDQFLSDEIPDLSRTEVRKIIDLGGVHLNGRRVRTCSLTVQNGAQIEMYTDGLPFDVFRLADEHILYRDKYILVLNKPAGIDTQPTPSRYKGTLYDALLSLLGPTPGRKKPELGMVQRLDRGTSGLMVFSTHQNAHRGLSKIFLEHQVDKRYLALVGNAPHPAASEIRSMLARSRKYNRMVSVQHGGKNAITRYQTRQASELGALLEIELLTGRSHQIRAHLSEAGSALLGDSLYGGAIDAVGFSLARPMLHAFHLAFKHPVTAEELTFDLPMPADMQRLCDKLFSGSL